MIQNENPSNGDGYLAKTNKSQNSYSLSAIILFNLSTSSLEVIQAYEEANSDDHGDVEFKFRIRNYEM
jgi:hypothetical protein